MKKNRPVLKRWSLPLWYPPTSPLTRSSSSKISPRIVRIKCCSPYSKPILDSRRFDSSQAERAWHLLSLRMTWIRAGPWWSCKAFESPWNILSTSPSVNSRIVSVLVKSNLVSVINTCARAMRLLPIPPTNWIQRNVYIFIFAVENILLFLTFHWSDVGILERGEKEVVMIV